MRKLIGNINGISGIYEPEDNVSLVKNLDDLSRYVYNSASNNSIYGATNSITDLYLSPDESKVYFSNSLLKSIFQYNISGQDLTTDYFNLESFSVTTQETTPNDLFFKSDGTKVYIVGTAWDTIYQYSLGTAWDISTASYDSKSFSVTAQDLGPNGLFFKDDGTKVYIVGTSNDRIHQYSLGTAWDISTASYDSKSFSVATQETTPNGLFFKSDGTKVYIVGSINDRIHQYSLGTAWDISTASYDSKSFSVATQETTPNGLFFKSDGTKVYIVGSTNDTIYQYSLGTAWDISTASYDSKSFSVGAQESAPSGLFFKDDGTKVYIVGTGTGRIHQYSLGTAWVISTCTVIPSHFIGNYEDNVSSLSFNPDGTKVYIVGQLNARIFELPLTTPWDVTTAPLLESFSIATQELIANDLFFKSDGTKVYIVGSTNDTIYQYSLSVAWNISTASYDSKSFSVGTQETLPNGLFFKDDGTKVYIVGTANDRIYQYSLGTAWDISTASYDSKSFSVGTQETLPNGLFFKDDGTKVYIVGTANDRIYQYSLGTAWDISTASYDSKSFSVATQETTPNGLFFKSDGTKVYIVGSINDRIHQYSLGTAWDISTASYDSKSFSVGAQETTPYGLFFKDDGTKVYIVGSRIYEFPLTTAWDITSSINSFSVTAQESAPSGLFFKDDGTKVYIVGTATDTIYQYSLSVAWNISTASYDSKSFSVANQETAPNGLFFKSDGTKVYIVGPINDRVFIYNLTTPWDISTAVNPYNIKSFSVATQETTPNGLFFKDDGTKVYIVGTANDRIYQYSLGTAWDISTASYDSKSFSVGTQETLPNGLFFKDDGTKVYIVGTANDRIYQYSLGTAWDISTASYDSKSFSVGTQETTPNDLFFKSDGTKVYIVGPNMDTIYQYSLGTAWDISTASYDSKTFSVTAQETTPNGLFFKSDGTKVYIVGDGNETIYQYSLSVAWNISTASYDSKSFSVTAQETTPNGLFFKDDGTKVYIIGSTNDRIYQYDLEIPWELVSSQKSLYIGGQDGAATGIVLNNDLSKLYMVGVNTRLYEYDFIF